MTQDKNNILLNDCFAHDKQRMRHEDAINLLKQRLKTIASSQIILLENAIGRILAKDIGAPRNIPLTDNSAVDGYAFRFKDYQKNNKLPVSNRIAAGDTSNSKHIQNTAARIFTGAPMPKGADTIAMQEDCKILDTNHHQYVELPLGLKQFSNCRKAGEDVKTGEIIARSGEILTPQLLAAIASTGKPNISVYTKLKIGLISNGNELLRPQTTIVEPKHGQVFDSNHFMLRGLLASLSVEIIDYGILPDDYAQVKTALKKASIECDIVISSAGASKGDEDHIITALEKIGARHLWQLAVKPGRPMSFGQISNTPFFGLPGNPVACFICFVLYVRQSIQILAGANYKEPQRYALPAGFDTPSKKPDRREFLRGTIETDENGKPHLQKFSREGSGLITSLRQSNGLIEINEEITSVKKGDLLNFIPFSEFGI